MTKNTAITDSQTLTNFFDTQALHGEFKNFPAARCQPNGGHTRLQLFIELV